MSGTATASKPVPWPRARAIALAAVPLALAGLASLAGNALIVRSFPDRPAPRDLLFELLPYVGPVRYLTAVVLVISFALFIGYAFTRARDEIPAFVAVFGLMYLLRAGLMVLTPLADAQGPGAYVFPLVQHGMFPSGHTAAALLCARLVDPLRAPRLRRAQGVFAAIVAAALVLSHGHYSIDVAGGALLAYFVEQEWRHGSLFGSLKRALAAG